MRINIPENVKRIIRTLNEAGYEGYAVGGCVRDSVLGRKPKDWDITTNAKPLEVKALFRRTVDTGIKHGTVTVLLGNEAFEVTTYRIDGVYEDSRHPKEVTYSTSLEEDLLRRDFTINAMAYNDEKGLVDLYDGMGDLSHGIIRAVGVPTERFSEDALRILRAVRFASELDFDIEPETLKAMKTCAPGLKNISAERIRVELEKLVMGKAPEKINIAVETGICELVFPEWLPCVGCGHENRYHKYDVDEHIIQSIKAMHGLLRLHEGFPTPEEELAANSEITGLDEPAYKLTEKMQHMLCITMLLHDIAKPECKTREPAKDTGEIIAHFFGHEEKSAESAKKILRRLKYDNETVNTVTLLIRHHDDRYRLNWDKAITGRRLLNEIGPENAKMLIYVQLADAMAHHEETVKRSVAETLRMKAVIDGVLERKECYCLADLAVKGADLMEIGYKPGPGLGVELKALLDEVIAHPGKNDKELLLALAEKHLQNN